MTDLLKTERDGDVAIAEVQAALTLGCGLKEGMKELAQAGVKCLILDFSNVAGIDSAGLGELIAGHVSVTQAGGSTILLNVSRRSKELLRLTRLSGLFPTYNGAASVVRGVLANRTPHERSSADREAEPRMLSEVYLG